MSSITAVSRPGEPTTLAAIFSRPAGLKPNAPADYRQAEELLAGAYEHASKVMGNVSDVGRGAAQAARGTIKVLAGTGMAVKDGFDVVAHAVFYATRGEWMAAIDQEMERSRGQNPHLAAIKANIQAMSDRDFAMMKQGLLEMGGGMTMSASGLVEAVGHTLASTGLVISSGMYALPEAVREGLEQSLRTLSRSFQFLHDVVSNDVYDSRGNWVRENGVNTNPFGLFTQGARQFDRAGERFAAGVEHSKAAGDMFLRGAGKLFKGAAFEVKDAADIVLHSVFYATSGEWLQYIDGEMARQPENAHLRAIRENAAAMTEEDFQLMRQGLTGLRDAAVHAGLGAADFASGVIHGLAGLGLFTAGGVVVTADALREYAVEAPLQAIANGFAAAHNAVANEKLQRTKVTVIRNM